KFSCDHGGRMTTLGKAQLRRIHVANSHELCCLSLSEVARKIRTPIAIPYHTYAYYLVPHSVPSCQVLTIAVQHANWRSAIGERPRWFVDIRKSFCGFNNNLCS